MSLLRPLLNLLLVLALVASGPLSAFEPGHEQAPSQAAAAPCHDDAGPGPAQPDDDVGADCCGGDPGYCGCDCLHHVAAAPLRPLRISQAPHGAYEGAPPVPALPRSPTLPDTRPPIA